MADIHALNRGLPINPNREHASPPTRMNTFSTDGSDLESDATGSSMQSTSSTSSTATPSIAKLAALLNFPPLPPPAPTYVDDSNSDSDSQPLEYNSGIMMAGRFIDSLCPKPAKKQPYGNYRVIPEPHQPVAGWTDGSNAWRASVYSFSSPKLSPADDSTKPYSSVSALSHRSRGTQSSAPTPTCHTASLPSSSTDLITKFSESFNRRSELRSSLHSPSSPTSPHYPATTPSSQKRERSLLMPGAEGKLLVPDVKLKVNSASSTSLSSAWSVPTTASSRRSVRSPLSSTMSDFSDEEVQGTRHGSTTSLPHQAKRPTVESGSSFIYILFLFLMCLFQPARGHTTTSEHILLCNFPLRLSSEWSDKSSMVSRSRSRLRRSSRSLANGSFCFPHPSAAHKALSYISSLRGSGFIWIIFILHHSAFFAALHIIFSCTPYPARQRHFTTSCITCIVATTTTETKQHHHLLAIPHHNDTLHSYPYRSTHILHLIIIAVNPHLVLVVLTTPKCHIHPPHLLSSLGTVIPLLYFYLFVYCRSSELFSLFIVFWCNFYIALLPNQHHINSFIPFLHGIALFFNLYKVRRNSKTP